MTKIAVSNKKKVRQAFRDAVFSRDRHTCRFCDSKTDLDAHHITDRHLMPNGGYVLQNGISLCPTHHMQAEQFHISGGTIWEPGMHPNDLYKLIGSSYASAVAADTRR